jgi:hypothetical protein
MANEFGCGMTTEIEENINIKWKSLYRTKLANYIPEAIQENLLTSTAKEVSARTDLLQAVVQFIAES